MTLLAHLIMMDPAHEPFLQRLKHSCWLFLYRGLLDCGWLVFTLVNAVAACQYPTQFLRADDAPEMLGHRGPLWDDSYQMIDACCGFVSIPFGEQAVSTRTSLAVDGNPTMLDLHAVHYGWAEAAGVAPMVWREIGSCGLRLDTDTGECWGWFELCGWPDSMLNVLRRALSLVYAVLVPSGFGVDMGHASGVLDLHRRDKFVLVLLVFWSGMRTGGASLPGPTDANFWGAAGPTGLRSIMSSVSHMAHGDIWALMSHTDQLFLSSEPFRRQSRAMDRLPFPSLANAAGEGG